MGNLNAFGDVLATVSLVFIAAIGIASFFMNGKKDVQDSETPETKES